MKEKIADALKESDEQSQIHLYSYLENHLKAEMNWLKALKKGGYMGDPD